MDFFLRRYLLAWKLAKLGSIVSCLQEGVEKQLPTLLTFSTKDNGNRQAISFLVYLGGGHFQEIGRLLAHWDFLIFALYNKNTEAFSAL